MAGLLINEDVREESLQSLLRESEGKWALLYDASFLVGIFASESEAMEFGEMSIAPKEYKVRMITYKKKDEVE